MAPPSSHPGDGIDPPTLHPRKLTAFGWPPCAADPGDLMLGSYPLTVLVTQDHFGERNSHCNPSHGQTQYADAIPKTHPKEPFLIFTVSSMFRTLHNSTSHTRFWLYTQSPAQASAAPSFPFPSLHTPTQRTRTLTYHQADHEVFWISMTRVWLPRAFGIDFSLMLVQDEAATSAEWALVCNEMQSPL